MQTAAPLAESNPAQGRGVVDIGAAVSLVKTKVALPSSTVDSPDRPVLGPSRHPGVASTSWTPRQATH